MRMVRNVAMAVAILASATMANADSFVWYEAANTSGNSAGAPGGAQGTALNLTCDTTLAGPCSWVITMRSALGAGGILGWSADLQTAASDGVVSVTNPAIVAGPFNNSTAPGTPGALGALLVGSHGQTFSAAAPQTLSLLTFTLNRTFTAGNLSVAGIRAGTSTDGSVVWTNETTADYENVGFSPNPAASGQEGTFGLLPSIIITNVPEPTSLGLLAVGAMALLRRRAR